MSKPIKSYKFFNILNPKCMWLILHLFAWRNLYWVWCNDSTCYTQVLIHVFLIENYKMQLFKNKNFSCIPHRYMLEMVNHPIIINVPTRKTNRMQLIARIYVRRDVLFKAKLLHYTVWVIHLNKLKKYKGDNWCL